MSNSVILKDLFDENELTSRVAASGLSRQESENKAKLFGNCARKLNTIGHTLDAKVIAFYVPGRIEVLGKHTDYAGGRSILAATEKGFCLVAVPAKSKKVRIFDLSFNEDVEFIVSDSIEPKVGHWSNYPMTAVRRLAKNFPKLANGADIVFQSDLPPASGMSSSSAMIVAFFLIMAECNDISGIEEYKLNIKNNEDLAGYLGTVENGQTFGTLVGDKGVGTFGGSEDHTAVLCCQAGFLSQYSYCPIQFEQTIEFPAGYTFVVASSGVAAEKTGSAMEKYNRISKLARCAVEVWNNATGSDEGHLATVLANSKGAADSIRKILQQAKGVEFTAEQLVQRFEHFLAESEQIIPAAGDALAAGDISTFSAKVDYSQQLTETLLENQVPETIFLAKSARRLGAVAASAFGAGFGGSVWAMVKKENMDKFIANWSAEYKSQFPKAAAKVLFIPTRPGPAAFHL